LYNNVKIFPDGKRGLEESNNGWEQRLFAFCWVFGFAGLALIIHFIIQDMVEQNFQSMSKVRQMREMPA
jgi:hypothetical protein